MSIYKELRYNEGDKRDKQLNWQKVDAWLRKAIDLYQKIKVTGAAYDPMEQQPLFIDLIIKITIIRSYANLQNKKLLTSEKLLEFSKVMITLLEKKEDIEIQDDLIEREYAEIIPLDILKQKYLLNSGILFIALNQDKTACKLFTDCLRTGEVYDPRIRRDCVIQLQKILEKQGQ
jgi:hypothetical protein